MITDRSTVCGPFECSKSSSLAQSYPAIQSFHFFSSLQPTHWQCTYTFGVCVCAQFLMQFFVSTRMVWNKHLNQHKMNSGIEARSETLFSSISKNCEIFSISLMHGTPHENEANIRQSECNIPFFFSDFRCKLQFSHHFGCGGSVHLMKYVSRYFHGSLKLNWNYV